jgi:hypothetical protein
LLLSSATIMTNRIAVFRTASNAGLRLDVGVEPSMEEWSVPDEVGKAQ